ncbi:hypothetical protein [Thomasclavelia cocleata]|uniref:hypothetical protein n=1 Tax=Thomasclavelia cocleata TaxID=69824 RepID=UPI002557E289|nr:hypothetical protein [Thomasclavelia cocleata]
MTRNKLTDLNNHLFEQLERLNDDDLTGDELKSEIERSKAISNIAGKIIENASIGLEAEKLKVEYGRRDIVLPEMLENKNGQKTAD